MALCKGSCVCFLTHTCAPGSVKETGRWQGRR
jgi:hypothetical protein